ncbi:MAG: ring-cleaving dioxygenase [Bacteroidota bacterium]
MNDELRISGIHHVSAISGPAQRNVDYYAGVLGLRLVKRTVNFDDPNTYHLYYGSDEGRPGTIMTFFCRSDAVTGRAGPGMATRVGFLVGEGGVERWMAHLADLAVDFEGPQELFGCRVLPLRDADGLLIELVEDPGFDESGDASIIRGLAGVTLSLEQTEPTARLLTDTFGFAFRGDEQGRLRFEAPGSGPGRRIDLTQAAPDGISRLGRGVIHHVAFRAADEREQLEWRERLLGHGFKVTPMRDRQYFKSIYFREPGGVLFEIATDAPGFLVDEMPEMLGTSLRLPPWLEARRPQIEQRLTAIRIPE